VETGTALRYVADEQKWLGSGRSRSGGFVRTNVRWR